MSTLLYITEQYSPEAILEMVWRIRHTCDIQTAIAFIERIENEIRELKLNEQKLFPSKK